MEPQQERGFWSQLTTFSKVLIFLVVAGVLGGSAWYILKNGKEETAATTASADTVAVSDGASTSVSTDKVASDSKEPAKVEEKAQPNVSDVAVDEAPAAAKAAEPAKKVTTTAPKKAKATTKKSVTKKESAEPTKPKKKSKNNEDVEVDI
ncbi:putative iron-regulated membrane protein [Runella defluvii]|uniref:Putative iron-regulated membrane protein n=1 Tax=Runella defluvii TaxID=370973 RepID=A0A7W5ZJV1_9BACT|nr:hypothetical protein [Runella defluvii]MBB3838642.1 putative iron-regulated membrane protein [Runella defluvii]